MPVKSPFNYIGNKYRIIDELCGLFPRNIHTFVDLFCGGCDVSVNIAADVKYANDINYHIVGIFEEFKKNSLNDILDYIDRTIEKWHLSKDNEQSYLAFREYVNQKGNPLDLYTLMNFSFNYQFRFNSKQEYNNTFGRRRSSFNESVRNNLIAFHPLLANIIFSSIDFVDYDYSVLKKGDFLYADPPYILTCGSYNDGKRGFRGWTQDDDIALMDILSRLSKCGVNIALSNVIEHKGLINENLLKWAKDNKLTIHDINFNYNNCNYQSGNRNYTTREVLITNY